MTILRHRRKVIFALTVFFYTFFIPYFDHAPRTARNLDNPNENSRVYGVAALVEHGQLHLDTTGGRLPLKKTDLASREKAPWDSANAPAVLYFPGKSPGSMLFVAPFYYGYTSINGALGRKVSKLERVVFCRFVGSTLPSIFFSYLLYLFLHALSKRQHLVDGTYLVYLLGTMAYPHSVLFVSHQLASAALFVAFGIFVARPAQGWRRTALYGAAGFLMGLAASAEYSAALSALVIGLYALARGTEERMSEGAWGWLRARAGLLAAAAGAAIPVGATLVYHDLAFGSPWKTPYDFLVNPAFRANLAQGWHGFVAPRWSAFSGAYLRFPKGLFSYSPFLLLAFVGVVAAFRGRRWRLEVGAGVVLFALFALYIASFVPWRGGWSAGPRYIANIIPFMVAGALIGLDHLAKADPRSAKVLLAALGTISISLVAPVAALFPHLPDAMNNPFHEAIVPLLRLGLVPQNVLGLPPLVALLIYAAVLAAVLGFLLLGDVETGRRSRLITGAASLMIAVLFHAFLWRAVPVDAGSRRAFVDLALDLFINKPLW